MNPPLGSWTPLGVIYGGGVILGGQITRLLIAFSGSKSVAFASWANRILESVTQSCLVYSTAATNRSILCFNAVMPSFSTDSFISISHSSKAPTVFAKNGVGKNIFNIFFACNFLSSYNLNIFTFSNLKSIGWEAMDCVLIHNAFWTEQLPARFGGGDVVMVPARIRQESRGLPPQSVAFTATVLFSDPPCPCVAAFLFRRPVKAKNARNSIILPFFQAATRLLISPFIFLDICGPLTTEGWFMGRCLLMCPTKVKS